ncbi:hypothetical protein LPJ56_002264 [Coemansia sp. RSA 2599]|nr:hypothetical protein LPJ56_002264 [Coemansia sp. RSA 2599]
MRRRSQKPPGVSKAHEEDGDEDTEQQGASAMPKIPRSVVGKLVSFSLLLLVAPILCYFVSLKYIFVGATASSAIVAVIAANLVLAAFVYSAWNEELEDRQPENKDSNRSLTKQAAPRE